MPKKREPESHKPYATAGIYFEYKIKVKIWRLRVFIKLLSGEVPHLQRKMQKK